MRNYAHLLKSKVLGGKKAADPKEVDEDEEAEEQTPPKNDREDGKKGKKSKSKYCEDDDNDTSMSEGEDDDKREKDEGDEGEDDEREADEDEDKENDEEDNLDRKRSKKSKKSSSAERDRCARIFASKEAAGRPDVAARLAFHSNMSADEAINLMALMPTQAKRSTIDERMNKVKNPNVGIEGPDSHNASASSLNALESMPVNQGLASMEKMSPSQRALAIVNAGRSARGEQPLKNLPGNLAA